ncbi:glycerophosphoryl diester phosphodiesterase [Yersinia pseudotuberculosis]|nr:glycerophosphodiester phosphodiesterase [Yersinia pseudotuberculosis]CFU85457.1 glycerophosphoryl diester phosphodiesterase [Yersinia pseudotuberculosis]CNB17236.1 glycerophosphoryl diester phosphodiesterase [Yersinia pseudotuberculosis]CNL00309.1 glycerophosphoryl diester phosphodiesterase [Yersinia pseudotuberculosis]CNL33148.1 glycerophosphoryl diester phosphodiesterase [Yersinia pseudotuberculosis]
MRNYIMTTLLLSSTFTAIAHSSPLPAPQIIAHRAGTADAPENTFPAISKALANGADAIWITLQLSKDNIPVLYRPSDLKELTNESGAVSAYTASQLAEIDASIAYNKKHDIKPSAGSLFGIPTLDDVLKKYPDTIFYLDIKSPDADPIVLAKALQKTLLATSKGEKNRLIRTRVYSTNDDYLNALDTVNKSSDPSHKVQRFESRDTTRTVLANITMDHQCELPIDNKERWYGLELHRKVEVVEKYTLGEGRSSAILSWDKEAMDCFRKNANAHIILFGINTQDDYKKAKELQANGVMVDSPAQFKEIISKSENMK